MDQLMTDATDVAEQMLEHLLGVIADAVIVVQPDGTVRAVNRAAVLLLGQRAEVAVGQPVGACLSAHPASALDDILGGVTTAATYVEVDGRPGQRVTVDVHASSGPWGLMVVLRDLTEQVETQQVLTDIHDQQRELERLGQVGRWELDRRHGELQWSEQVVELLGIDPLEVLGTADEFVEMVRPDHRAVLTNALVQASPEHEIDEELPLIRGDGSEAWIRIRAVVDPSQPDVLRGIVQDVSRLRDALEEARRVNDDVVRFAGVIAHDLRSPMATIAGMARLLGSDRVSAEDRATLEERILSNSLYACEQIELLLGEALRTTSRLDAVPMVDVVSWVANLVQPQLEEVGMTLTWDPLPTVWGRTPLLRQAVLNLVGNSIKYGRHDGGVVHVSARGDDEAWEVLVEDDGPGVPDDQLEAIFDAGVRLDRQGPEVGSGIGLDAVRRVMGAMGGSVHAARSTTLSGLAMVLRFPRTDPHVTEASARPSRRAGDGTQALGA